MKRSTVGILSVPLFCIAFAVTAGSVTEIRPGTLATHATEVRAGMLVTGSIVVAPDGSVQSYALDEEKKLPGVVINLIGKSIPAWKFEPTKLNGEPVAAKATMNLRVVATRQADGGYAFSISGATFPQLTESQKIAFSRQQKPVYPRAAMNDHVSGTVYLLLRLDQEGNVISGFAEQVNLKTNRTAVPGESFLKRWRAELANASLNAARNWKFGTLKAAQQPDGIWYARVPIAFALAPSGESGDMYGKWDIYLPGPIQRAPWADAKSIAPANLDALSAGSLAVDATALHLTTPLGGS